MLLRGLLACRYCHRLFRWSSQICCGVAMGPNRTKSRPPWSSQVADGVLSAGLSELVYLSGGSVRRLLSSQQPRSDPRAPSGSHAACHLLRGGFRDTLANPLAPCHPTLLRLRIEGIHDHGRQRMRWYHAHRSDDGVDESRLRNDLLRADHRHNFRDETRPCLCGVGQSLLVARWPTTLVSDEYLHSMMSAL